MKGYRFANWSYKKGSINSQKKYLKQKGNKQTIYTTIAYIWMN